MKKHLAHEYFDSLHDFNPALRQKAYEILAERMATYAGFPPLLQEKYQANLQGMQNGKEGIAHIRYFNEIECEAVIEIVKALYQEVGITIDTVGSITSLAKSAVKPLILNHLSLAKFLISPKPEAKSALLSQPIETSIATPPLPMGEEEKAQFMSQRLIAIQTKMIKEETLTEAEQMLWYGVKEQFYDYDHSGTPRTDIEIISACYQSDTFLKEITELYPELVSEYQKELALRKEVKLSEALLTMPVSPIVEVKKPKAYRSRKPQKNPQDPSEDTKKVQHSIQAFNREVQHQVEQEAQLRLAREAEAKAVKERLEASLRKQENPPIVLKEEEVLREKRNQYFRNILGYSEEQLLQERKRLEEVQDEEELRTQYLQIVANQLKLKQESKLRQEALLKEKKLAQMERQNQKLTIKKECEKVRQEIEWLVELIFAEEHLTNKEFIQWLDKEQYYGSHQLRQLRFKHICMLSKKNLRFDVSVVEQTKQQALGIKMVFTSDINDSKEKPNLVVKVDQQRVLSEDYLKSAFSIGKFFEWLGIAAHLNEVDLEKGIVKFSLQDSQRIKLQKYYVDSLCSFMQTFCIVNREKTLPASMINLSKKFTKLATMYYSATNHRRIIALLDEPPSVHNLFIEKIATIKGAGSLIVKVADSEEFSVVIGDKEADQETTEAMNRFIYSDDFRVIGSAVKKKPCHFSSEMLVICGGEYFLAQPFPPFNQTSLPPTIKPLPANEKGAIPFVAKDYVPLPTHNQLEMFLMVKSAFPDHQKPSVNAFNQLLKRFFDPENECRSYLAKLQLETAITEFKKGLRTALRNQDNITDIIGNTLNNPRYYEALSDLKEHVSKTFFSNEMILFTSQLLNVDKGVLIELCQQKSKVSCRN